MDGFPLEHRTVQRNTFARALDRHARLTATRGKTRTNTMYGTKSGGRPPGSPAPPVRVEHSGAHSSIGTITFDRAEALNAFSSHLCGAVVDALDELETTVSVIVLRGAGGNFSVGGDIEEVRRLREEGPDRLATLFDAFAAMIDRVQAVEVPVVAAVEGYALAGGFELVQVCDVVLLSETAVLGDHHIRAGQIPAGGGSQRLPRMVGRQRALAHLITGDRIDPATAVAWGLAYRAAPPDVFQSLVDEVCGRIADKDPGAVRMMKSLVDRGLRGELDAGLDMERAAVLDPSSWRELE